MKETISLKGRVAAVTGANRGIGAGVAAGFARRGAEVALWDIAAEEGAQETLGKVREHCANAVYVPVDVADRKAVESATRATLEQLGRVDVLVNNAGIYPFTPFLEMPFEEWQRVIDVDLTALWLCAKAIAPDMVKRGYGKIINVSSIQFMLASPDLTHYVAAKGGVLGLTRSMARDLGKHGIRVNSIMPGAIVVSGEPREAAEKDTKGKDYDKLQCLPGRIYPEDIEPTFAFLAAEESDAITGQAISVDKGRMHW